MSVFTARENGHLATMDSIREAQAALLRALEALKQAQASEQPRFSPEPESSDPFSVVFGTRRGRNSKLDPALEAVEVALRLVEAHLGAD